MDVALTKCLQIISGDTQQITIASMQQTVHVVGNRNSDTATCALDRFHDQPRILFGTASTSKNTTNLLMPLRLPLVDMMIVVMTSMVQVPDPGTVWCMSGKPPHLAN